ncbi:hypothetical protein ACRPK8_15170, partial [Exiguobacterium sp. TDN 0502]|uniref:hypothetical protein n=1 Tax=Exiguobacterium sp. TDN 0502 TaxID=3420731 RepID=UPI003D77D5B9
MYRNRSPNLFIILMIVLATSFPVPHSHAIEELEIPTPLTSSFCEETLNDPKKKDLLETEEHERCKELLETELKLPTDPPTPETPRADSEDPPTPETPRADSEDPPTPETPRADS